MVVQINQPQRPAQQHKMREESELDKIFKGLQIVQTGFGIAVNIDKLSNAGAKRKMEIQALKDKSEQAKAATELSQKRAGALPTATEAQTARDLKISRDVTDREHSLFTEFTSDKQRNALMTSMTSASNAAHVLRNPENATSLAVTVAQRMLIRAIEPGVINQNDVTAYSANPALWAEWKRFLSLKAEGKPLKLDARMYRDFANILQNKAAGDLRKVASAYARSPKGAEFGASEEVMTRILNIPELTSITTDISADNPAAQQVSPQEQFVRSGQAGPTPTQQPIGTPTGPTPSGGDSLTQRELAAGTGLENESSDDVPPALLNRLRGRKNPDGSEMSDAEALRAARVFMSRRLNPSQPGKFQR